MKAIFALLLVTAYSPQVSFAQNTIEELKTDSAKLYVEYILYNDYINDSVNKILYNAFLFLGKQGSVYTYQTQNIEEFFQSVEKSVKDERYKKFVVQEMKKERNWERQFTEIQVKSYDSPYYLSLKKIDKEYYWLPDTVVFRWKPINEFKIIDDYTCQKAVGTFNGSEVVAWFTEQVPIPSGPGSLSGLPGLILEYYNPLSKVFYKAISISTTNIPQQKFREWFTGAIISKAEYKVLAEKSRKNIEQFQKMIKSGKISDGD